jgi:putative glutamine amidotransferase
MSRRPVVGVTACVRLINERAFNAVHQQYMIALMRVAEAMPLLIPTLGDGIDVSDLLHSLDGIVLTGSPSNVEPRHYDGATSREGVLHDPARDATTLPLIRAAVAEGVPVFGICRGLQEMNVAFGGTLHQHLQEVPGRFDHRHDRSRARELAYAPKHDVSLAAGGYLRSLTNVSELRVNSLHGQGVDRLGKGLVLEAEAPDATVEGFRVDGAKRFAVGVQWHPEGLVDSCGLSASLFARFGEAARERAAQRYGGNSHG